MSKCSRNLLAAAALAGLGSFVATHAFADDTGTQVTRHQVRRNYDATLRRDISAAAFALIQAADARRTIGELLRTHGDGQPGLFDEILALWDERWVMVRP